MIDSNLIKTFSEMRAVSGHEERISGDIADIFQKFCDDVRTDNLGNVIALKKGKDTHGQKIMIEAHMDEIGLMVTDIDDKGFLYFAPVGGIDARILPANEVVVHGRKDIFGVIGAKPPHVLTSDEMNETIPMDKLYIDTGYNAESVRKLVSVGDTATFGNKFLELKNGVISTKSQDDRSSVAVLVMLMKRLAKTELPFDIYYVAAVQEEVGLRGARTAAYAIEPDFAVVIDVCHASTPDSNKDAYDFGSGAIISKGPNIHPMLVSKLTECLDSEGIEYTIDVDGGDTGTDAWAVQVTRCGIPTVLFSIPLRYMHTPVETVSSGDIDVTVRAIAAFLNFIDDTEDCICLEN